MRVFVSSVMKGFDAERAAARRAVELLRHDPVMAEDFGAQPQSSQSACLDQVHDSDVYVGILGARYGFIAPSGRSVTEEEFEEARKRGLRILVFVSGDAKETSQEEFIRRVGDYGDGYFFAKYATPQELQEQIVQALHDLARDKGQSIAGGEAGRLLSERTGIFSSKHDSPVLVVGVTPSEKLGELLAPRQLGDQGFHDEIKKLLLFGQQPRLFDSGVGTEVNEGRDYVQFHQVGRFRDDPRTAVVTYSDGTLALLADLESERKGREYSIVHGHVVDRNLTQEKLQAGLQFAAAYYRLLNNRRLAEFYLWADLRGVGSRQFGVIPDVTPNGMSMSMRDLGPSIKVTEQPVKVSLPQLAAGADIASDFVERLARIFKASGSYYEANR